MNSLRYRQIHLDFHTSPDIPEIGKRFDKTHWQQTLQEAEVNSVTLFAKCHHGWSYHPTQVGKTHPHLDFDLLRTQYDACKEININCPIYLSAGVDNLSATEHPEWRQMDKDGRFSGWATSLLEPGYRMMDFHSPYLDYLCAQIREVVALFPDCDGIFLDIISQKQPCGRWSMDFMLANGLDPEKEEDRIRCAELGLLKYYEATTPAAKSTRADMPVFHNAGHIFRGRQEILSYFSHLELESLPTGGWGYDHFPMSAKYTCNLPLDFLGMTGKFHTTWGEFGGYKHPNALRYECAAMLAYGSKCSIGDQLHPSGELDPATYAIIGQAYREVASKEMWCNGSLQVFDIGILSSESEHRTHGSPADEGICRALLESHFLFGLIDRTMDFGRFKLLILPDDIRIDEELKAKLDTYLAQGGKLILSGESGLWKEEEKFAFDIGADYLGASEFSPDFILPVPELRASYATSPQVMYERSRRIRVTTGKSLGQIFDPYFNRTYRHFCSHQHTPYQTEASAFDCGVHHNNILYFSHPVFRHYRMYGAVVYREFIVRAIRSLLGNTETLSTNLPSTARVTLTWQPDKNRFILHLLYAPTINRGGKVQLPGVDRSVGRSVEVIEDLPPIHDTVVSLRLPSRVRVARLVPEGQEIPLKISSDATVIRVEMFHCHQMVELELSGT